MKSFSNVWNGGYFEGNPLDPMSASSYGVFGYTSVLNVIYQACIKPYVNHKTIALEIGPGRGAFSKAILQREPRHMYAVDAAPPEHTKFWSYIEQSEKIEYLTVSDSRLDGVPDGLIDYVFSFGCLCHVQPEAIDAYIESLAKKMRSGANGFMMIADYDKYNYCNSNPEKFSILRALNTRRTKLAKLIVDLGLKISPYPMLQKNEKIYYDPGRFYNYGLDRANENLRNHGFEVVELDMNICQRDPVIHFQKI